MGPQLCVKLMTNSRSLTPQTHCEAMRATFSGLIEKEKETVKIELEKLVKKVQAMSELLISHADINKLLLQLTNKLEKSTSVIDTNDFIILDL